MIFLLVSILQSMLFSTLSMVSGESPAFLASSDLLISSSSLIFFTRLTPNQIIPLVFENNGLPAIIYNYIYIDLFVNHFF
jgi:hypothetical protein